jgi:Fe-S-cluster containining protein
MENVITSEICKKCAECCKNFPFVELSQTEIHEIEKLTDLPSELFTNQKSEVDEEYFLQLKENGDCFFLNEKNGDYSCGVYAARSGICRNYPSNPKQKEACNSNREEMLRNNSGYRDRTPLY